MFSKISARIFIKVLNAPTIGYHFNSKAVCLRSLSSSNNIDDPLMTNGDRHQRKTKSSVFNVAEASQSNILNERKEFMAVFPEVLQDISEFVEQIHEDKDLVDQTIRVIKYNVPRGKQPLSMSLIMTYLDLVDRAQVTPESMKMIRILAWILEMVAGSALVADDIIYGETIRHNQPCWHLVEDVKLTALNDVLLIENLAYFLLKKYFSHLPCYPKLFEVLHKAYLTTMNGQNDELLFVRKGVQQFKMDDYKRVSYLKTAYGSCCLPFALPTKFIGIDTPELYRQTNPILYEIGLFKQIQNDFYGCFGDSGVLRKTSPNTENGQFTWLAVKCMELATPAQRKIMIECFGKHDSENVRLVKQLYEELNIPHLYYQLEDETYDKLAASIKNLSCGQNVNVAILNMLNIHFNRV